MRETRRGEKRGRVKGIQIGERKGREERKRDGDY